MIQKMPNKERLDTRRAVDANLNRAAEGLRVLEDVARFLLDREDLTGELRALRRELRRAGEETIGWRGLLAERDTGADVGLDEVVSGRRGAADLVAANARRVQEACRVLEELGAAAGAAALAEGARRTRYRLYVLEKNLAGAFENGKGAARF